MTTRPLSDNEYLFTSESVTEGHPDKMADQISDGVLDAVMRDDPTGRVACETLVNTGLVVVSGEISTDVYVDVARRAGFDPDRCGRPLLADEALLRVDPRFIQNARLLAAVAEEAPTLLERWAGAIVASYAEILKIEPLMSSSLLIASQLDSNAAEVSDEVRTRNARLTAALRAAAGHEPGRPESDPLEAGIVRWLRVVSEADQRAATLDRLLAQIASEDAEALRQRLA